MCWSARRVALLIAVIALAVAGCAPVAAGWRGDGVHLVDGTWIGWETACGAGDGYPDEECRTVVELAQEELPLELRPLVTNATLAELPTTFVGRDGKARTTRLGAGILTRKAVVLDLTDGGRRVIGLWCYLPYFGGPTPELDVSAASCEVAPLEFWLVGNEPPHEPQVEFR